MFPFLSSHLCPFSWLPLLVRAPRETPEPGLELLTAWKEKQINTQVTPCRSQQVSTHRGRPEEDASFGED